MATINLLPWRDELKQKKQQQFIIVAGVAALLMAGVVAGVHAHFQGVIDFQGQRNAFLETAIEKLKKQIVEIESLKKQKERLLGRMDKIVQLQATRPDIVHMMDELVETQPEGVYFTQVRQKSGNLTVVGVAQSNARVSSLMRQVETSQWLENPALVEIKAKTDAGTALKLSDFTVSFRQQKQKKPEGEEESGG